MQVSLDNHQPAQNLFFPFAEKIRKGAKQMVDHAQVEIIKSVDLEVDRPGADGRVRHGDKSLREGKHLLCEDAGEFIVLYQR